MTKSKPGEWLSILSQGSKSDSPQRKLARLLLSEMPRLDQATATRRMKGIKDSDAVQGPLALSWMLNTLARMSQWSERHFFLNQAEMMMEEAVAMRKLRRGWSQFGVSDPWFVVYPEKKVWLPRYHSEPTLSR